MELDPAIPPLESSARIRRKATQKLPDEQTSTELHDYFAVVHSGFSCRVGRPPCYKIGDAFTLLVNAAEVFSNDPVRLLLSFGMVVFPESVCVDIARLSAILVVEPDWLSRALLRDEFRVLDQVPESCIGALKKLGFIDSDGFQMFTIPETEAFAFSLRTRRAIVQPFPVEMIEMLIAARAASAQQVTEQIHAYVEEVRERLAVAHPPRPV
jgi:hypothetical protein